MKTYRPPHPTTPHERQKASKTMKRYTITTFTKANRTEYFHAVTVEAENVKSAKEAAAEHIRATLDRHAFRMSNATAPASVEYTQWIADRFNVTVEDVMKAAAGPEGVDIYADEFKPAPVEAENPINSGNAPLYVWTFANGAESAATLTAEASSAADATEYARAARICANEAAEAAEIAGTAEAAKDAERARIAADNAEAIRAYWDAHEEAKAAESAEAATSAAALDYDHITAAEHAAEAEKHADAAEKAAHEAAAIADEAHDPEVSSTAEMAAEEAYRARQFANDARETAEKNAAEVAELKDVDAYANAANTCADSAKWAERKAEDATTAKSAAAALDYDTEADPRTGRTVWTPEAVRDLWTICERHELYSYSPAEDEPEPDEITQYMRRQAFGDYSHADATTREEMEAAALEFAAQEQTRLVFLAQEAGARQARERYEADEATARDLMNLQDAGAITAEDVASYYQRHGWTPRKYHRN